MSEPNGAASAAPQGLAECEALVERGVAAYREAGEALKRIRDERLYRKGYSTFEAYCQGRWGWGRAQAYRLIEAAEIAATIVANVSAQVPPPATEGVARELTPLKSEPKKLAKTWRKVVREHGPKPTATQVRVQVYSGGDAQPRRQPKTKPQPEPAKSKVQDRARARAREQTERKERRSRLETMVSELGGRSAAVTACQQVSNHSMRLLMTLYEFDFDELDVLDEKLRKRLMDDVFDDVAETLGVVQSAVRQFQVRTEDRKVRETIAKLRAKADSSEFPHEAASFHEAADRLEFGLKNKLAA